MKERINVNPKVLAGKPVIRGTRIPVYLVLNLLVHGKNINNIVEEYPELEKEDVIAAINYAAENMKYEEVHELEALS